MPNISNAKSFITRHRLLKDCIQARILYNLLSPPNTTYFTQWIERFVSILKLEEGKDYLVRRTKQKNGGVGAPYYDYLITLRVAWLIIMLNRNRKTANIIRETLIKELAASKLLASALEKALNHL